MRRPRIIDPGPGGIRREMETIGVDPTGIDIMEEKALHVVIRLDDVELRAALILKQDMLSLGGEAALRREAAGLKVSTTPVLLMGTLRQMRGLVAKMEDQPFGLKAHGRAIVDLLETRRGRARFLVGGKDILAGSRTAVMGILNVTEDSFSDGGVFLDRKAAVARGLEMVEQGADIVDVGGESTRPGALPVPQDVEMERVVPVIGELVSAGVGCVSVDTTKSEVARKAVEAGASIINDISAMTFDAGMPSVAASLGASVVLMHTRGRPETMQDDLDYHDLMGEVCSRLEESLDTVMQTGVPREKICLDPGIGFGKSLDQNLEILARLGELGSLGTAVMVGASRKSFLGALTGAPVLERTTGSVAAAAAAVFRGADIVRVHDVAPTVEALAVVSRIRGHRSC